MSASNTRNEIVLQGVAASPGVAHGPVVMILKTELEIPSYRVSDDRREDEVTRFEQALLETRKQIAAIRAEVEERLGEEEARIFDAHQLVLEDRALIEETIAEVIETGFNIEYCFHQVASRYIHAFSKIDDEYLKERVTDIRDVSRRVLHSLLGRSLFSFGDFADQRVIVADELTPSETAHLDRSKVLAFVTNQGSRTSHAVIMARSLRVPAVVGLHNVTELLQTGDTILVDGYDGIVTINPTETTLFRYGKIQVRREHIEQLYRSEAGLPAESRDGIELQLYLNIEGFEDPAELRKTGGTGVGLFRTEAIFLRSTRFPTEAEQFEVYRRVVEGFSPQPVTIRTLDLGGDKASTNTSFVYDEANPFMGLRAIRFCLEQTGVFKDQLRAILRASAHGKVRIMFPMISGVEEFLEACAILEACKDDLRDRGQGFDNEIEVGSMIEIPSAACVADHLAMHCDFFSIGTNDLIQYMMAVDRVNDRVAHLYDPNHPAILRTVQQIIDAGNRRGIPVSICGEIASDPVYAILLFGMGASEISISPVALPEIKFAIRHMTISEARTLAKKVVASTRAADAKDLLQAFYREHIEEDLSKIV